MSGSLGRNHESRKRFAVTVFACTFFASGSHGQSPAATATAAPAALQALGKRIDQALAQSKYEGLDQLERRTAATLAVSASMMVDSGRCTDASASGSAAETLLFTLDGLGRQVHQPVFALSESAKNLLIDLAMDVESHREPAEDLTGMICHDQILPASATKPLSERRAEAREVLALALSPPRQPGPSEPQHQ